MRSLFITALFWLGLTGDGQSTVISPTAVLSNTMGEFSSSVADEFMIDQSGLSDGFTSGVTKLEPYLALNPKHDPLIAAGNMAYATPTSITSGAIDLDLGAAHSLDTFLMWSDDTPSTDSAPKDFQLFASSDSGFTALTLLGNFVGAPSQGGDIPAQLFSFSSIVTRYIRLVVLNTHDPVNVNIGEIAFAHTTPVPLPIGLPLFATGLASLLLLRRRVRRRLDRPIKYDGMWRTAASS